MFDNTKRREVAQKKEENVSGPHPDWQTNKTYFEKMLAKVQFCPEIKVELQHDEKGIVLCALVIVGPAPSDTKPARRTGAYNISFHEKLQDFRAELCGILNTMGKKGLLRRIDRPIPPIDPDDKYAELFGGLR